MNTPYFPALRSPLAALGRRTARNLLPTTVTQLQYHLRDLLPAPLLSSEEEGPNSRQRVFSLRLTFECFIWQMLKPKTSCREVVRQVQALCRLNGRGLIDENDWSLRSGPPAPAAGTDGKGPLEPQPSLRTGGPAPRAGSGDVRSRWWIARPPRLLIRPKTKKRIPNPLRRSRVADFQSFALSRCSP